MNGASSSTPLRDRDPHQNASASRFTANGGHNTTGVYSIDKKLGASNHLPNDSSYIDGVNSQDKRITSSGVNGQRSKSNQRLSLGLNHSEPEDDSGRFTSRIPKDLRHDPDIQAKLNELDRASNTYLKFDMNRFQNEMNRELESHIGRLNQDYK
jgi:hypothetical protein